MDWKFFGSTFATVLVAELGDKTQFAAMAAGARDSSWTTLLAVVLGLTVAGGFGFFAGRALGSMLNPHAMRWVSGSLFIAVGVWTLMRR